MSDFVGYYWRVGRKVGRTIYAQLRATPSDDDPLIGVMDTPMLASHAVTAHNAVIEPLLRGQALNSERAS